MGLGRLEAVLLPIENAIRPLLNHFCPWQTHKNQRDTNRTTRIDQLA